MKNSKSTLIAIIFLLSSCGANSDAQSEVSKLIHDREMSTGVNNSVEVLEVEFIQNLTAKDSLKFLNPTIKGTNDRYNKLIKTLNASATYLQKSKSKLYYGTSTRVNPYYKKECDRYIRDMKKTVNLINDFDENLQGDYSSESRHIFMPYNNLKKKKDDEVVAKIYRAKVRRMKRVRGGVENIVETSVYIFNPTESKITSSMTETENDKFSIPQGEQEMFFSFQKFSVNDEGNIKKIQDGEDEKSEVNTDETKVIASYQSGEFIGYCFVRFENDSGEIISFINPNLGEYANPDNNCLMKDSFLGEKFEITFVKGDVEIYIEDVGDDIVETRIITKIELIN
ncbi:MAG: hypothetical protein WED10_09425 [Brumimicrobium sp.]